MASAPDISNALDICSQVSSLLIGKSAADAALGIGIVLADIMVTHNKSGKGKDFFSENDTMVLGRMLYDMCEQIVSLTVAERIDYRQELNKVYDAFGFTPAYAD